MRQACPGEMMTYTCTVTQGFLLDWIIEPFISGSTRIRFALGSTPLGRSVDCNGVSPPQCSNISFVATFTNTANPMNALADMTSTLTITTTVRLNGTVVQCRGTTADGFPINSSTVNVAGTSMLFCCLANFSHCLTTEIHRILLLGMLGNWLHITLFDHADC